MITLFVVVEARAQEDVWPATVGGGNDLIKMSLPTFIQISQVQILSRLLKSDYLSNVPSNLSVF